MERSVRGQEDTLAAAEAAGFTVTVRACSGRHETGALGLDPQLECGDFLEEKAAPTQLLPADAEAKMDLEADEVLVAERSLLHPVFDSRDNTRYPQQVGASLFLGLKIGRYSRLR